MPSGKYVTPEERARILELTDKSLTSKQIAARFGLSRGAVSRIKRKEKVKQGKEAGCNE